MSCQFIVPTPEGQGVVFKINSECKCHESEFMIGAIISQCANLSDALDGCFQGEWRVGGEFTNRIRCAIIVFIMPGVARVFAFVCC